jgi:POT family proton-dependent oligopeptide transporter
MGINVGGALGPIVCGFLGETGNPLDYKWAFFAGGIAMLLSVVVQLMYQKKYVVSPDGKELGLVPADAPKITLNPVAIGFGLAIFSAIMIGLFYIDAKIFSFLTYLLLASVLFIAFIVFSEKSLSKIEKQRIGVIFIVAFFVIFFWSAFEQAGASLTFFAEEQTQRNLGFLTVPASIFASLNSIFVVAFAPLFAWLWIKLGKKEPSSPTKMAIGLLLLAIGYLWIAFGVKDVSSSFKVSMMWLIGMYALHTCGELCLSPIGLSLVNKLAPLKFASLLMAVWFLANAAANKFAGILSSLYPPGMAEIKQASGVGIDLQPILSKTVMPTAAELSKLKELKIPFEYQSILGFQINSLYEFFMMFVVMAGIASVILFAITKKLQKMMHQDILD